MGDRTGGDQDEIRGSFQLEADDYLCGHHRRPAFLGAWLEGPG